MMRNCAIVAMMVAACVMGLASPAAAQPPENAPLAALDIAVWPEYDQPAVLVIYRAQLAADAPLPANVFIRIPASVVGGKPHAVAGSDPAQGLLNIPYTVNAEGDGLLVSFTTAYQAFQLEFYDAIDLTQPERRYTLTWPGDASVDSVTLQVQEPFGAHEFKVTPEVGPGQRENDGLVYHLADLGGRPAGQPVTIELAYTKTDARTSVDALSLTVSAPTPQPASAPSGSFSWPGWMIAGIVLGVGLIAAGVIWYLYSGRDDGQGKYRPTPARRDRPGRRGAAQARRHAAPRSQRKKSSKPTDPAAPSFCTQCGQSLGAADTFCPQCGAPRRTE
jgi:hypothetical protein